MSAMREEIHYLVDQVPEERLAPVLQLIGEMPLPSVGGGRRPRSGMSRSACAG
jgi:hypothetical protein